MEKRKYFFDDPRNVKKFLLSFYISLVLLVIIDFFIPKHPYFPFEEFPSFYATFGFVACVALVLAAKFILRPIVKRKEGYYDK